MAAETNEEIELVTDKKHRYLLKAALENSLNEEDFDLIQSLKNCNKYTSEELMRLVQSLEEAEDELKTALLPFIRVMFKKFHENKAMFSKAIAVLAELDCLCALGHISADDSLGPMTKPEVHPAGK